ncbi:MAG: hypothetical protein QOF79_1294, partial [Actinomycetota bacterium]|nr:hypothetical protein [Actinomycetota bacterium]
SDRATLIHITSDPQLYSPDGGGWWDVPVAAVSSLDTTTSARADYLEQKKRQKPYLGGE